MSLKLSEGNRNLCMHSPWQINPGLASLMRYRNKNYSSCHFAGFSYCLGSPTEAVKEDSASAMTQHLKYAPILSEKGRMTTKTSFFSPSLVIKEFDGANSHHPDAIANISPQGRKRRKKEIKGRHFFSRFLCSRVSGRPESLEAQIPLKLWFSCLRGGSPASCRASWLHNNPGHGWEQCWISLSLHTDLCAGDLQ